MEMCLPKAQRGEKKLKMDMHCDHRGKAQKSMLGPQTSEGL